MDRQERLLFFMICTIVCTITLLLIAYGVVHTLVFPDGRFVDRNGGDAAALTNALAFAGFLMLLACGFCIYMYMKEMSHATKLENASEHKAIATVISKTSQLDGAFFSTTYVISFGFPDRSRKVFDVDKMQYAVIGERETGLLTYKQNKDTLYFVDFRPMH